MRIDKEQEKKVFIPVTITLESEEELAVLLLALNNRLLELDRTSSGGTKTELYNLIAPKFMSVHEARGLLRIR